MQESCTCGSVRGAPGNLRPYRDIAERIWLPRFIVTCWHSSENSRHGVSNISCSARDVLDSTSTCWLRITAVI